MEGSQGMYSCGIARVEVRDWRDGNSLTEEVLEEPQLVGWICGE